MSPSERQLEDRQMRKERILSGALEVFKAKGLEGATMDEIASREALARPLSTTTLNQKRMFFLRYLRMVG